ncbi:MAG TPA: heme-binding protein [Steroidobacteraceae bacterium]|jgi:glc operon protein GlcG|nr:heme-binding protein [Steroidobacteraceae bacterium]
MKTKSYLVQDDCRRIIDAATAHARARNWAVSICVCDDGGHILRLERLDGAPPFTAQMAMAKASTAALGRRESKTFEEAINQGRTALVTAPIQGLLEGGVPVIIDGQVIAAVGVSGVKSVEDAEIARAGIAALTA